MHDCSIGRLSFDTAWAVHCAIIASFVVGWATPPARLSTIKTSQHPTYAVQRLCQDTDCVYKEAGCKGNRYGKYDINYWADCRRVQG